ncbi:MAG: hypothetical protein K9N11_02920 [Lentisphaeria bacterium]|nr:hypothetical protein [Candidatus Neomarinimicrobiota bacterium]MCF7841784.1 hypothetical protein [Lentisphaeria bacterium]
MLKSRLFWVYLAVFALMGCGNPKIIEDTVQLDQAFIPLLYATEQGDSTTAEIMAKFDRFVRRWQLFYGSYYTANQINPKWGLSLDKINQRVNAIEDSLVDRKVLSGIHTMLESIRDDLTKLRWDNQIAYALDEFTAFHTIMKPMWAAADSMVIEPDEAEKHVKPILHHMVDAEKQWRRVQMVRIDPILFDLTETEAQKLHQGIQTIQAKLTQLNDAINRSDIMQMAELVRGIKPEYEKIYLLFGNFD